MEAAVIAEAPSAWWSSYRLVPEVEQQIVILHAAAVLKETGWQGNNAFLEELYGNCSFSRELLKLRRLKLMKHLQNSLASTPDVPTAVKQAFNEMNVELERVVGVENASEMFWRVQYNSMVVIVENGHVYIAGDAVGRGMAMLCRDGKDKLLTRSALPLPRDIARRRERCSSLCYYHKEKLTEKDLYLVVGTNHILSHVDGHLTPCLTTRIDAFGLEEACKQIVGRFVDAPRTFVVVPLGELVRERVDRGQDSEPCEEWGMIGPDLPDWPPESESDEEEEEEEEEAVEVDSDYYVEDCPRLLPLVNGKPQRPQPITTCWPDRDPPRDPSIRVLDLKQGTITSKHSSCTVIIRFGNIGNWCVDGKTDAIVVWIPCGDCKAHAAVSISRDTCNLGGASRIIYAHDVLLSEQALADTYREVLTLAQKEGIKHVAFPDVPYVERVFSGCDCPPVDKLAKMAIEAIHDHRRQTLLKKNKLRKTKKREVQDERVDVHFVLRLWPIWNAFVAATDLLACWEYEKWRARYYPSMCSKPSVEPSATEARQCAT